MPARKSSPSRLGQVIAALFTTIVAPVVVNYSVHKLKIETTPDVEPPHVAVVETVKLGPPVPQKLPPLAPQHTIPDSERLVWRPAR